MATHLAHLQQCRKCLNLGKDHVLPNGPISSEIMLIAPNPTSEEVEQQKIFTGAVGELLDYTLDEANLDRSEVYITHLVKCRAAGDRKPYTEEVDTCILNWMSKEIKLVNPSIVILLGKHVHQTFIGDKFEFQHLGVVKSKKRTYIMSYHPMHFLTKGDLDGFLELGRIIRENS